MYLYRELPGFGHTRLLLSTVSHELETWQLQVDECISEVFTAYTSTANALATKMANQFPVLLEAIIACLHETCDQQAIEIGKRIDEMFIRCTGIIKMMIMMMIMMYIDDDDDDDDVDDDDDDDDDGDGDDDNDDDDDDDVDNDNDLVHYVDHNGTYADNVVAEVDVDNDDRDDDSDEDVDRNYKYDNYQQLQL